MAPARSSGHAALAPAVAGWLLVLALFAPWTIQAEHESSKSDNAYSGVVSIWYERGWDGLGGLDTALGVLAVALLLHGIAGWLLRRRLPRWLRAAQAAGCVAAAAAIVVRGFDELTADVDVPADVPSFGPALAHGPLLALAALALAVWGIARGAGPAVARGRPAPRSLVLLLAGAVVALSPMLTWVSLSGMFGPGFPGWSFLGWSDLAVLACGAAIALSAAGAPSRTIAAVPVVTAALVLVDGVVPDLGNVGPGGPVAAAGLLVACVVFLTRPARHAVV